MMQNGKNSGAGGGGMAVPVADSHFHSTAMADRGLDPRAILLELSATAATAGAGAAGGQPLPLLDVAIQPEDAPRQRSLTGGIPGIHYSMGLHPGSSGRDDWETALESISRELSTGRYHAVGETGLDWFRMYAPRERQITLFEAHLQLADHHRLPVIIHNRNADEDCLHLLKKHTPAAGGVMHCYSSDPEWVTPFLNAGMYISFAGNLTYKNAGNLREALALVPEHRLLLETDAPFLAPVPFRGKLNHPGLLYATLEVAAAVRGVSPAALADRVAQNLFRFLQHDC